MFPHADTISTINALDHEHLMRRAASQRLAASAQGEKHRQVIMLAAMHQVAAALFGGWQMRWRSERRVRLARPLTTG
jgi:hypothetical protein